MCSPRILMCMSTIQRHDAGTRIAGQATGGQFKTHERSAATAPTNSLGAYASEGAAAAISAAQANAAKRWEEAARAKAAAQAEISRAMAILARDAYPDAHTIQLERGLQEDTWSFGAVLDSGGNELQLASAAELEMDRLIMVADWGTDDLEAEEGRNFDENANFVIDDLWEEHEIAPVAPDPHPAAPVPTQLHPELNSYIEEVLASEGDISVYALDGQISSHESGDDDYSDAVVIVDGIRGMRSVKFTRTPEGELTHYDIH